MDIVQRSQRMMPWHGSARCWAHDWVLDLDIKSFFDEIDWNLLMRAVRLTYGLPMGSALP